MLLNAYKNSIQIMCVYLDMPSKRAFWKMTYLHKVNACSFPDTDESAPFPVQERQGKWSIDHGV